MKLVQQIIRSKSIITRGLAAAMAIAAFASGCAYIDVKQRELIWRPSQAWWTSFDPRANGVEELWITRDGRALAATRAAEGGDRDNPGDHLHAWWWPAERADAPVLLYLHGARWNLNGNAFRIARLRKMGFSVLAVDYRGFGRSGGDLPSEEEVYADATIAWEYLAQRVPSHARRFVFGHSLGGALAIDLAARRDDMAGVIVESTLTSIRDMAGAHKWLRFVPVSLFLTQHYDSLSKIERVSAPILFVHGADDGYVPSWMAERLYERTRAPKRMLLVEGANHSNVSGVGFEQYFAAVRDFFALGPAHDQAAHSGANTLMQ